MVYYTFVFPTMEQRRKELSARLAVYSMAMARHQVAPLTPEAPRLPMCGGCGSATGSWCDACEARGLYFRFPGWPHGSGVSALHPVRECRVLPHLPIASTVAGAGEGA